MAVKHLTINDFDEVIKSGDVLVDFWATWCAPCRMLAPVIDSLAEKYDGKVQVCKVDVDEQGELAARYGVMSIPTVILFRDGQIADKRIGVYPEDEYDEMLA